jgi:hypothetical protein
MTSPTLEIRAAPRFTEAINRAGPGLTAGYLREIYDFVRRYDADPLQVARQYDRAEHLKPSQVLEFDVGGGPRMLGHWDPPTLRMLNAGEHDIVKHYDPKWLAGDIEKARALRLPVNSPTWSLFGDGGDAALTDYGRELHPDWVYFLADHQAGIASTIRKSYKKAKLDDPELFVLAGGPGTGKTSILVKLLIDFTAAGLHPAIILSDAVANFIEAGLGRSLAAFRPGRTAAGKLDLSPYDVLLYDDPDSLYQVEQAWYSGLGEVRLVVVGFDPCQMDEDVSDSALDELIREYSARKYELKTCYRQKETVGRATKRVMDRIADSTPYLDTGKVQDFRDRHGLVYRLSNDLRFPNPSGYERTYADAKLKDVRAEVNRLRRSALWAHVDPLLVVLDTTCETGWHWDKLLDGIPHELVGFDPSSRHPGLRSIKGLEYQHAFLVLNYRLARELERGFDGTGKSVYRSRRLLRIPFSRAKDSVVTFVFMTDEDREAQKRELSIEEALRSLGVLPT